ncbi:MAG: NADH-quinone oxidoreductase subunit A [Akkermansiaceae bacterium]
MLQDYFPALLQALAAIGFAAAALGLSVMLGKRGSHNEIKETPYECGMIPVGDGAPRFSVKFYLVAMLFVIFDIEVVFMYPWAVQFFDLIRDPAQAGMALWSMAGFAGLLAVAYVYALKKGALNWKS